MPKGKKSAPPPPQHPSKYLVENAILKKQSNIDVEVGRPLVRSLSNIINFHDEDYEIFHMIVKIAKEGNRNTKLK